MQNPEPRDDFQVVLLGGDIGVYALARAFHERYGTVSHVVTRSVSGPVADSSILTLHEIGAAATSAQMADALWEVGSGIRAENPGQPTLLLANSDRLIEVILENSGRLGELYVLPSLPMNVFRDVSDKATFAQTCESHGIPTPRTEVVDFAGGHPASPAVAHLGFPAVAKAASSAAYAEVSFPGKRKVFEIGSQDELDELVDRMADAGYGGRLVVQEMIPGDDTTMLSVTAYVDRHGEVTMLGGARVLLGEHTPGALGNPAAMIVDRSDPAIALAQGHAVQLLAATGYRGYANFDVKIDPRDGIAKFFEVNPRIGRNNYYMTAAGANVAEPLVRDRIDGGQGDLCEPDRDVLYSIVPLPLLRRYVRDRGLARRVREIARARSVHPLLYGPEGRRRKAYVLAAKLNQVKKFARHYPRPTDSGF